MGRLWPNGEFSLGYTRDGEEGERASEWLWANDGRFMSGEEMDAKLDAMEEALDAMQSAALAWRAGGDFRLSLSSVCDSHRPLSRTQQGLKGLTSNGAKMLRSACFLLEERLGRDDCVMITLTVPTLGRDARRTLALQWGSVTNRLVQYLTRALVSAGRPPAIAGCVEIQTGRLEKYRQAYLHLHLICPAHSNTGGCWAIDADALRTWWRNQLERTLQCTLPNLPRIETAIVQKSVEGYLGKYLSKGSGEDLEAFIGDLGMDTVPAQWWFMSSPMKAAVRSATKSGANAGALLDALVNHLLELGDGGGFEYVRHIDCNIGGLPVTVGWVGRLSPGMREEVFAMLDA